MYYIKRTTYAPYYFLEEDSIHGIRYRFTFIDKYRGELCLHYMIKYITEYNEEIWAQGFRWRLNPQAIRKRLMDTEDKIYAIINEVEDLHNLELIETKISTGIALMVLESE